jgi:HEPN domain-containing protein
MDRTTSWGLWTYGQEFFEAAEFMRREKGETSTVAYYLVCHSIELLLKAFLRSNGYSSHKLKKVMGHDLGKLLKEVRKEDIEKLIHLRDEYLEAIPMITGYYKGKDFEYIETGSRDTLL